MTGPLRYSAENGIATLTLDRPDVGNAINVSMAERLLEAAIACEQDPAIRCVVLTGAGRLFCAGGDLGVMADAGDRLPLALAGLIAPLHAAVARLAASPKPLIVLVNGPAAGAGMGLALLGDVVLASHTAHFTPAYGSIGLTADAGLSWILPRVAGLRHAQEIMLTDRRVGAEEAASIGLVTRVVEASALASEGAGLAARLIDAPTAALGASRALLLGSFESKLADQLGRELRSMTDAGACEAPEGIAALLAKRKPEFKRCASTP